MRSHAAAIAWEFRRRHRWGFIAAACYLLVLAILRLLVFEPGAAFHDERTFAFAVVVPASSAFGYFLAVFSFGLSGDLAARESIYPARLFTLPMTAGALAGWPMLYGAAVMAFLWLATRSFAIWPSAFDAPLVWPALLAASFLAWTQALAWMPYPFRGLRVIAIVSWLPILNVVVITAHYYKVSELVMLAILTPQIPLAFLAARYAVARARRGDVPDWHRVFARLGRTAEVLPMRGGHLPSPASAQAWLEWRQSGRSLPVLVGILLPFELSMIVLFRDTPAIVFETLVAVVLTPPFMAVFVAATVSGSNSNRDSYGVAPFIATKPLTNASLIGAKLRVTVWSTLATWLLVLVAVSLALKLSGTWPTVIDWARNLVDVVGTPRAIVILLLGFSAILASTWKQLVQSMCIGMSGREWAVKGSVFLALSSLAIIVPVAQWIISNRHVMTVLWNAVPWIAAVLVSFKMFAAAWIAMRLHDSRLLSDRTLILGAACWAAAVFALYGLFVWLVSTTLIPSYFLALVAILEIPLARLSAAPLALAWNRHR